MQHPPTTTTTTTNKFAQKRRKGLINLSLSTRIDLTVEKVDVDVQ
jgi:hypothetical protein